MPRRCIASDTRGLSPRVRAETLGPSILPTLLWPTCAIATVLSRKRSPVTTPVSPRLLRRLSRVLYVSSSNWTACGFIPRSARSAGSGFANVLTYGYAGVAPTRERLGTFALAQSISIGRSLCLLGKNSGTCSRLEDSLLHHLREMALFQHLQPSHRGSARAGHLAAQVSGRLGGRL